MMYGFRAVGTCSIGDFYTEYSNIIWNWAVSDIFAKSAVLMAVVLGVWCTVWLAWLMSKIAKADQINWDDAKVQIALFFGASCFLGGWRYIFEVVDFFMLSGLWLAGQIITATTDLEIFDMGSLVCTIAVNFQEVYDQSFGLMAGGMNIWSGLGLLLLSLMFIIPWFVLWVKMIKSLAMPIMSVFAVLVLSAPTAVLTTVPWFRRVVQIDFKIVLASVLELPLVAAMFGVAVTFLNFAYEQMPVKIIENGGITTSVPIGSPEDWLGTDAYWMALFVMLILMWCYDAVLSQVKTKLELTTQAAGSTMGQIWGSI